MRARPTALVLLFIGCAHAPPPAPPPPISDFSRVHENIEATVLINVKDVGSGTAFIITEDGYLLTCAHIVGDAKSVDIVLSAGAAVVYLPARVVHVDRNTDLALLKSGLSTDPVILGAGVDIGAATYAVGFPYTFGELAISGFVARMHVDVPNPEDERLVFADMTVIEMRSGPGTSGSGVFLQRDGSLIGVVNMVSGAPKDMPQFQLGIAIPIVTIRAFLDAQHVKYRTR